MQFNTHEDRIAAIENACVELGQTYGELKFKEHMLREMQQSFVPGQTEVGPVASAPAKAEVKAEVKADAPAKAKAKPKAAPKPEPVVKEVEGEEAETATENVSEVVEATVEGDDGNEACPISSAIQLRQIMLEQFNASGRSAEVQMALKKAILESTGCDKVMDVTPEQVPEGYAAIMAVEV